MQRRLSRFLEADVEPVDEGQVVLLKGELDIVSCAALAGLFHDLFAPRVVLDLAQLSFVDAAGVEVLLSARDLAGARGQRFTIVGASGLPRRVLALFDLANELAPATSASAER